MIKKLVVLFMVILMVFMASVPLASCQQQPEPIPAPPTLSPTEALPPTPAPTPAPPAPIPTPTPTPTPTSPPPVTEEPSLSVKIPPLEVAAGETLQLEVIATDQHGNRVSDVNVAWTMIDKNAGSVTQAGLFTAGEVVKTFSNAVEVQVSKGELVRTTTASVNITPGPLAQVVIAPDQAEIGMKMTQQFVVVGADQYGNRISDLAFSWNVENGSGRIRNTGLFTAGIAPGTYEDTVKVEASQGSITRSATANVTVEPDRIVFLSGSLLEGIRTYETYDRADIYIMDADGSNVKQLTDTAVTEGQFSCSPDGQRIAYDTGGVKGVIMVMSIDGDWKFPLTDEKVTSFAWSSDGSKLVLVIKDDEEEYTDIYVIDADGGNLTQLTDTSKVSEGGPSWSPDDTQIGFSSYNHTEENSAIFVMDADGGNVTQLTEFSNRRKSGPAWSPKGTQILFLVQTLMDSDVYVINTDGSNQKRLITLSSSASWSPDGAQIVVSYKGEICSMNADGTRASGCRYSSVGFPDHVCQLTLTSKTQHYTKSNFAPAWSPDGSKIVFVYESVPSSSWSIVIETAETFGELYIMDADGRNKVRLTDNKVAERRPQFVPRKKGVEVTEDSVIIPGSSTLKK